jgi:hypothetical protein
LLRNCHCGAVRCGRSGYVYGSDWDLKLPYCPCSVNLKRLRLIVWTQTDSMHKLLRDRPGLRPSNMAVETPISLVISRAFSTARSRRRRFQRREARSLLLRSRSRCTTKAHGRYHLEKARPLRIGYRAGDIWARHLAASEALSTEAQYFLDCVH